MTLIQPDRPSQPDQSDADISHNAAGALGPRADVAFRETDSLETTTATNPSIPDPPPLSISSEQDAGLTSAILDDEGNVIGERADFDDEDFDDSDFDESNIREIPMSDLEDASGLDVITSPEMADMSAPGEVDIEALDEDAVEDALPPDARLDHLEP